MKVRRYYYSISRRSSRTVLCFVLLSVMIMMISQRQVITAPTSLTGPCDHPKPQELAAFQKAESVWNELHTICAEHRKGSKVSGGIFLYPRQSFLFIRLIQELEKQQQPIIRVCETGFGGGHSSALFLAASPRVQLITFDKFDRPYQPPAIQLLQERFGTDRITHVAGDTCKTVPEHFNNTATSQYCDVIHGSSFCKTDMKDLMTYLKPNGIVTATAMNTLMEKDVYFGETAQWRQLVLKKCIANVQCYQEQERILEQTYVFAKKGTKMQHQFCIAQTTGTCSSTKLVGAAPPPLLKTTTPPRLSDCSAVSRVPVPTVV